MTRDAAPSDRRMMEMAIEEMRLSIPERGTNNPLVGAAIRLPDGTVERAHRAHLRDGQHAEHSLLDGKLAHTDMTGSQLFVTLEPCGPGSRSDKEKPCAERIAEARISEVWFGIQDPHHTVDGKGLAYLAKKGITVRHFDDDLQEVIRHENADWLAAAMEDAARHRGGASAQLFDRVFDNGKDKTTVADLSDKALNLYRRHKKIKAKANAAEFRRHLQEIGVLDGWGADAHLTGLGVLLFGREPRRFVPQAGLNGVIHLSDDLEIPARFDSPAILIPDEVEAWLHANFPDAESRDQVVRAKVERLPYKAIREAVVNALVHRDYGIANATCHLEITNDEIMVKSPGGPVSPITLHELSALRAGVYMRNPSLTYYFSQMDLMEQQNLGMKTFRLLPKSGYPLPAYSLAGGFLTMTIYRSIVAAETASVAVAVATIAASSAAALSDDEKRGWAYLLGQGVATRAGYARALGVTERTATRHLTHFTELGLADRTGAARATTYRVRDRASR